MVVRRHARGERSPRAPVPHSRFSARGGTGRHAPEGRRNEKGRGCLRDLVHQSPPRADTSRNSREYDSPTNRMYRVCKNVNAPIEDSPFFSLQLSLMQGLKFFQVFPKFSASCAPFAVSGPGPAPTSPAGNGPGGLAGPARTDERTANERRPPASRRTGNKPRAGRSGLHHRLPTAVGLHCLRPTADCGAAHRGARRTRSSGTAGARPDRSGRVGAMRDSWPPGGREKNELL
jgi:hypothetical protein